MIEAKCNRCNKEISGDYCYCQKCWEIMENEIANLQSELEDAKNTISDLQSEIRNLQSQLQNE